MLRNADFSIDTESISYFSNSGSFPPHDVMTWRRFRKLVCFSCDLVYVERTRLIAVIRGPSACSLLLFAYRHLLRRSVRKALYANWLRHTCRILRFFTAMLFIPFGCGPRSYSGGVKPQEVVKLIAFPSYCIGYRLVEEVLSLLFTLRFDKYRCTVD